MMQTGRDPSDKYRWYSAFNLRVASIGGQVGCLTLLIVLGAVFGGIWLDRVFATKPLFTLLLVLGSAPLSLVLTYWLAMRAVKEMPTPPAAGHINQGKEDDSGE